MIIYAKTNKKRVKIDKNAMQEANTGFIIIVVILFILLTVGVIGMINPDIYDIIGASLGKLFN